MSIAPLQREECPPLDLLKQLLREDSLADGQREQITAHLDECADCQKKLDELAIGEDEIFESAIRQIEQSKPEHDSAYWKALEAAQKTRTSVESGNDVKPDSVKDLKLDFLAPTSTPGRLGKLGQFDIKKVIGRGGMGVVLQGFDASLHRDVAIKVLDPQLANNTTARQRFCREARAAAAVSHEHLVGVYQVNEDANSGLPFLVMQLVNGESLEQRLRRVGRLSVIDAVRIGMQSAAGLACAHELGLIHRDIKPGNILLEEGTDKAKLTDFGLARATEDMKLTRTGFVAGTPLYMAPEQARGDDIDARADLFSLGSVLYESLAGRPPFEGRTPLAVLKRVEGEAHVPLSELNPEVPEWLEDAIDRLLAKNPEDRFQTAAELSEYLSFKLSMLKSGSGPKVQKVSHGGETKRSLTRKRLNQWFCPKTAGLLATVFFVGLTVGGVGVSLLVSDDSDKSTLQPTVIAQPGDIEVGPEPLAVLEGMTGAVWAAAVSPDGKYTAIGTESGTINLWDNEKKQIQIELHPKEDKDNKLPAHTGPVWTLSFDADGKHLISVGDEGYVKRWNIKTGEQIAALNMGTSVRTADVNQAGNYVAIGDRSGNVRVMDLIEESEILKYEHGSTVNAVAFHPDGLTIASAGTDGNVTVWDIAGKRKRYTRQFHTSPIYGIAFSTDGEQIATAGWDRTVVLWSFNAGTRIGNPLKHDEGVWGVKFSPCGRILATAGQDGKTRIWEIATGNLLRTYFRHRGPVHTLSFSLAGAYLTTGGRDGNVRIWDSNCAKQ